MLLIAGCARSGNTLMKELCHVGFGLTKSFGEIDPVRRKDVDAELYKLPRASTDLDKYLAAGIKVIFMLRDPRAVLISRHLNGKIWVPAKRWVAAVSNLKACIEDENLLPVRFEDLIRNPNKVQLDIANHFNLQIVVPFTECWKQFDPEDKSDVVDMRGIRPMDPSRLEPWRYVDSEQKEALQDALKDEELVKLAKTFGYDLPA
jgi:hypothetical protein